VSLAKRAVDAALPPAEPGLLAEEHLFRRLAASEEARRRMRRFLELGGQTREVELDLDAVLAQLAE
jgi:hypothetical protein